ERGLACTPGVVLVGDRRAEERHHAVAGELVDRALDPVNRRGEDLEHSIEHPMPLFGVELLGQAHRVDNVHEQDTQVLSLTLERAPGGEDLLSEVARRVGAGVARHRRRATRTAQRCAAPGAESGGLVALVRAARTPHSGTLRRQDSTTASPGGVRAPAVTPSARPARASRAWSSPRPPSPSRRYPSRSPPRDRRPCTPRWPPSTAA